MTVTHQARLATAALLVVSGFGTLASSAFVIPLLALAGVLATLMLAARR